jgi:hypothetical protein
MTFTGWAHEAGVWAEAGALADRASAAPKKKELNFIGCDDPYRNRGASDHNLAGVKIP